MVGDHQHSHLDRLRGALSVLIYPLQQTVNVPQRVAGWLTEEFTSREDLQEENQRLRRAVSDLTLDKLILAEAAKGNF